MNAIINISTAELRKDTGLHLSGIDQEGSIFTSPKHNILLFVSLKLAPFLRQSKFPSEREFGRQEILKNYCEITFPIWRETNKKQK